MWTICSRRATRRPRWLKITWACRFDLMHGGGPQRMGDAHKQKSTWGAFFGGGNWGGIYFFVEIFFIICKSSITSFEKFSNCKFNSDWASLFLPALCRETMLEAE